MAAQTLFLFLFLSVVNAKNDCRPTNCNEIGPAIQFPFWLRDRQPNNCGSPGFNLICIGRNTSLNIPYSGDFYVKSIYYSLKTISLSDPWNCLARRLLSLSLSSSPFLNLSSSPFMAINGYDNFTFYSCPKAQVMSSIGVIDCLSNSSTAIVAVNYQAFYFQDVSRFKKIATVRVPARVSYLPAYEFPVTIDLTWIAPNISGTGTGASAGGGPGRSITFIIPAFIPLPIVLIIFCCICMRRRDNHESSYSCPQTTRGLDESTIETYKKMTISETRPIPGSNDTTCAICLEDYVPNDTLRFMPECEHCFHVKCIDKWLRMNIICPICRVNLQARNISPC